MSPNHSQRLIEKISLPKKAILLSNPLSSPEINVPIKVTDNTPIIMPNAVNMDLDLFERMEVKAIRKLSLKIENIRQCPFYY